ncbi:YbaN family protein [Hyphomonas sp.]|uniref:YbaN family protein n=2 Tax=Hyphomonas sp. TaxID=87 RepID=UPI0032EE3FF2|tara:strand:+ start:194 stop:601 length:408 start_codon:yes stop_codon:yes gene_type:complete
MWAWRILGMFAFALGAIGLALPIWPTTIFWIVAALAFARSNPEWAQWIYARPAIGQPIRDFAESGRMGMRSKLAALSGMALAAAGTIFLFWHTPWTMAISLGLLAVGAVFVISRHPPFADPTEPPTDVRLKQKGD